MALGFRYGRHRATCHFSALLGFRDFCLQENECCPEALKARSQIVPCDTPVRLLAFGGPAAAIARCLLEGRADKSGYSAKDSRIARVAPSAVPKFAFDPNWNQPPPPALLVQSTIHRKV